MSFADVVRQSNQKPQYKPLPYQLDGIKWVIGHSFSGLFFPPGLGKTAVVLAAFKLLKKQGVIDKLIVVAPLRVCHLVWPYESRKWSNFDFSVGVLHGPKKDQTLLEDHDIYCVNPEGLKWLDGAVKKTKKLDKDRYWLVVDESSNFKNSSSQRFKTIKSMLKHFYRRTILTGTPAPNGLIQLWSQMYLLDQGARLGSTMTMYKNMFFYPAGYLGYEQRLQDGAEEKIYAKIDDIVMHKSSDELDLPEITYNVINVELPPKVRTTYTELKKEMMTELEETFHTITAMNAAVLVGRLKQIANGGIYSEDREMIHLHDEKTSVVETLVEELGGRPLLVVYEFKHDLDRILRKFPDAAVIGGGVTPAQTEQIVNRWNRGELPLLLVHPLSAGHGLNLQDGGCHDLVWYSIPFDLELYLQTNRRVHRQGVKNAVTIHHIVALSTVDEKVMQTLEKKGKVQDSLLQYLIK